jgi:hypothetical protein
MVHRGARGEPNVTCMQCPCAASTLAVLPIVAGAMGGTVHLLEDSGAGGHCVPRYPEKACDLPSLVSPRNRYMRRGLFLARRCIASLACRVQVVG